MDWQALGAIGETLGALAVVATLVYLANQIRYARLAAQDTNRASRVEGIRELNGMLTTQPEVRSAWNKALGPEYRRLHDDIADKLGVSFDEASIIITQGASWGFTHWAQFRSMKSSTDERELKNIVRGWYGENPMRALIEHPNFRAYFEEEFVDWLDATIQPEP